MEKEHFGYKEIGYKFATEPRYVTPTEVDLFCAVTDTREDIFSRDDSAKDLGLGRRVIPALFVYTTMMAGFMRAGLTLEGLFIGIDNAEFKVPVHPYDRIRGEGEVVDRRVTSKGDRVVVKYAWCVKNEEDIVVAQGKNTCIFPNPKRT